MNQILKYLAFGIGGVMLLVGSFVTFSALTGTPMSEMKGVGKLFPEKVTPEEVERPTDSDALPEPEAERESDVRSPRQVYESSSSPLSAFALSDPFSTDELRSLEMRLQTKLDAVALRSRELDEREREIETDRKHVEDLYTELVDLRNALLAQEAETDAAGEEISRDAKILEEKREKTYREMATLFEDTKAAEAARLLTSVYGPTEAALILTQLDDERVRELLSAVNTLLPDEGPAYVKALQELKAKR